MDLTPLPLNVRSKIKTASSTECWPWTGARSSQGYGHVKHDGRIQEAHRVVYSLLVGAIPPETVVDHLCHTTTCPLPGRSCPHRLCQNPNHMELTTRGKNVLRGGSAPAKNARKQACSQGHTYTPDTTVIDGGYRRCLICRRAFDRKRRPRRGVT